MKAEHREELLRALEARFEQNMRRHRGMKWVLNRYQAGSQYGETEVAP